VDPLGIKKNHEFLPMVEKTVRAGRSYGFQNVNVPWPAWLEIDSIPSGPETWQRK